MLDDDSIRSRHMGATITYGIGVASLMLRDARFLSVALRLLTQRARKCRRLIDWEACMRARTSHNAANAVPYHRMHATGRKRALPPMSMPSAASALSAQSGTEGAERRLRQMGRIFHTFTRPADLLMTAFR